MTLSEITISSPLQTSCVSTDAEDVFG